MIAQRCIRVVSLWIHPGQEAAFDAYEREAVRIMARHGGRIDSAVRVEPDMTPDSVGAPSFEVHVVSFPDLAAADSYAADPETAEMRLRRRTIFARTELLSGRMAGPY